MATEYSLLTWAGLGTVITFTDAGDIVNFTAHGAPNGHAFRFTTTGTLPTGLTANTTYYLRQGADANKFVIHPTYADAIAGTNQITFTGTGSGTHKVVGEYWAALPATDPGGGGNYRARYDDGAGSWRVYAKISEWATHLNVSANKNWTKHVVAEAEGNRVDTPSTNDALYNISGYSSITITSKINGVYESGFPRGKIGQGYQCKTVGYFIYIGQLGINIDGIGITASGTAIYDGLYNTDILVKNCVITGAHGVNLNSYNSTLLNNIIYGCSGTGINAGGGPTTAIGNLVYGCGLGVSGAYALSYQHMKGWYEGNIVTGNNVNWGNRDATIQTSTYFVCQNNIGDTADVKTITFEDSSTPGTLTARLTAHGYTANVGLRFYGGVMPSGIIAGQMYWVKSVTTDTFTLSSTAGGAAIVKGASLGSGTIQLSRVWDTTSTGLAISVDASAFVDATNATLTLRDYHPSSSASPQVELITLADGDGLPRYDIADAVRPNYKAASFPNNKATAGPFEFDHGEGLAPISATLTLSGLQSGSDVVILAAGTSTIIQSADQVAGTTYDYTYNNSVAVDIGFIKPGFKTIYVRNFTLPTVNSILPISQPPDRDYL